MYHGERFNAWTHLVGTALSVTGTVMLIVMAALVGLYFLSVMLLKLFGR